ncbi:ACP S-malonyltransferase [Shewanella sp. Isolate7]|uniref:ACP S-malonyltransferase n=1 Tax=Shewanella sp. Isolate7 TaxID=2908528 RepID=UPI001EFC9AFA|nr:ACP S-malonyltransferase [Shewanella sp. Isolate7]MCG9721269.1 ACP S-malonyltransferase [Shewanella sp. Isolate7]
MMKTGETVATGKLRALVVAPGRGCYNKEELGYLARYHSDKLAFIEAIDAYRRDLGQKPIAELDAQGKYSFKLHTPGENASALIYACAMADFMDIDRERFDIVAVTGNSMGWYIALALAGALDERGAIEVINTMGSMMSDGLIGGQMIYPEMDDNWRRDKTKTELLDRVIAEVNEQACCELYTSIHLGGYRVLAGNEAGLTQAEALLPRLEERYPMRLYNHGAFHSPLLMDIARRGQQALPESLFHRPRLPMIDGRGHVWNPFSTDLARLHSYTLDHQVVAPYDFSQAMAVAVKEFAPDCVIVLGPGNTLGGPVAQTLIANQWFDWQSKQDFGEAQKLAPKLIAMGNPAQRPIATGE